MTYSDLALIAAFVVLVVAIVDWRRGRTGLGKFGLTKEKSPDKFWAAEALYFNMAFALFWLSGQAYQSQVAEQIKLAGGAVAPDECPPGGCVMIDVEQATKR
ncbi:hypothetical protein AMC99_00433 [Altererythrobacter epoxidivorans]|uniref:Uncharacterized protein n=1 Tax=Altererythrobacter epoxidivorans TaxID=361183 RepID=A0A0M4MRT4_9SPHN|nr:hypothetical protein [Altererythrobacter epoxidivorans]ALE15745.1 hypothetical protein AMC99_00433 [Altererythrobacter epoxidivorans]